ncbi:hypothetical protein DFH09DRAFT_1047209 [Mycena vulgaris]|nr:hypothetical protein DFH09DRAFT_1047209 [Mycena vulgaris]
MELDPNAPNLAVTESLISGDPHPPNDTSTEFPVIPPHHPFRTLVLCFDNTRGHFHCANTNIVRLVSILEKGDRTKQMVYYQAGIGTYMTPGGVATQLGSAVAKFIDEAVASNLHAHVMGGYEFLMQNYTAGDRICFFGFARGAYIARSLAGMIHKVGLLPACNHQQVPFAWKMYSDETELGWKQSNGFKKAFSIDVDIEFIGVWNTVNSVGIIPRQLPFTTSNTIVRTFRHAVSLDERRTRFQPNMWNSQNDKDHTPCVTDHPNSPPAKRPRLPHAFSQQLMERLYARDPTQPTDVDEVWFSGCHSDVGGGLVANETEHTLARIPLRWMVRECFKTHSGIMFDSEGLQRIGLDPGSLYPHVTPRPPPLPAGNLQIRSIPSARDEYQAQRVLASLETPSVVPRIEEEADLYDALSPFHDQLQRSWFWWFLEFFQPEYYQRKGSVARNISREKMRVHRTVRTRLEALTDSGKQYKPSAAHFDLERTTWVD